MSLIKNVSKKDKKNYYVKKMGVDILLLIVAFA